MGITGIIISPNKVFSSRVPPDLISAAPLASRNQSLKNQLHFEFGYGHKHLNTVLLVLIPKKHIVPNVQELRAGVCCWVHIGQFVLLPLAKIG